MTLVLVAILVAKHLKIITLPRLLDVGDLIELALIGLNFLQLYGRQSFEYGE